MAPTKKTTITCAAEPEWHGKVHVVSELLFDISQLFMRA